MKIETKQLSIGYSKPKVEVANNINLLFEHPGLIGIIGINGSGKSTLIKTLGNLIDKLDGQIFFDDEATDKISANGFSRKVSMVLSKEFISQNISVEDFVALGRYPYTNWLGINTVQDKKNIIKALQQVDLLELKDRKCNTLSDGQLQRALIARAIAQNTEMILLDEPTSHLDLYHKAHILKLLKEISLNDKKTILFSSHDLNLALQICDELIVISDQNVTKETPKALIRNGTLEQLFPKGFVSLDKTTGQFKMKL
jgi:iron complex transport system ATP-binding protein